MYLGFFYKLSLDFKGNEEMSPVKNLVSENKERLIDKISEYANKHINQHYDLTKDWHEGIGHYPEMNVYFMTCEVTYKTNPQLSVKFVINVVPVDEV